MKRISSYPRLTYVNLGMFLLAFGLVLVQIIVPFSVAASPSLNVEISANPASGPAPLNDVDLTASVSGSATGDITYKFDCRNDGSWERTQTTSSTSYTATDLCDYSSTGNYVAKISVEREGLVFNGTTAILVQSGSGLSVNLSANPSSGAAPLNDVDLTANVSGTATGDVTYRFDCTNDGSWERTQTTSSTSYTATDLCDYSSTGNYTAKVSVERGGLTFTGTAAIAVSGVSQEETTLSISKLGKNITQNQNSWSETVSAKPGETLAFYIQVTATGDRISENVIVSDILPNRIAFIGNLKIDDQIITGGNIGSGVNVGNISPGQSKTVTFEARVYSVENFVFGTTTLVNTGLVHANNVSNVTDTNRIEVSRTAVAGAATEAPTASTNYLYLSLVAVFIMSLLIYASIQLAESSQNRLAKGLLRRYYMFKVFVAPRQR